MLWVEFEGPPADNRDAHFVRVLTQTADPMLLQHYQALPEPSGYEQWSLDPELVRVVSPGQSDDTCTRLRQAFLGAITARDLSRLA